MLLMCATSTTSSGYDGSGGGGGSGGLGGSSKAGGGPENIAPTTGPSSVGSTMHHLLLPRKTSVGLNVTHGAVVNLILGPPPGSTVSTITGKLNINWIFKVLVNHNFY